MHGVYLVKSAKCLCLLPVVLVLVLRIWSCLHHRSYVAGRSVWVSMTSSDFESWDAWGEILWRISINYAPTISRRMTMDHGKTGGTHPCLCPNGLI